MTNFMMREPPPQPAHEPQQRHETNSSHHQRSRFPVTPSTITQQATPPATCKQNDHPCVVPPPPRITQREVQKKAMRTCTWPRRPHRVQNILRAPDPPMGSSVTLPRWTSCLSPSSCAGERSDPDGSCDVTPFGFFLDPEGCEP